MDFEPEERFPFSKTCRFAVAVRGETAQTPIEGVLYRLELTGETAHLDLFQDEQMTIKTISGENQYLRFDYEPEEVGESPIVQFKIISLTGECNLYFSKNNLFPDVDSNDAMIKITDTDFSALRTKMYNATLAFENLGDQEEVGVFVSIESETSCAFDITAHVLTKKEESNYQENIKDSVNYVRSIESFDVFEDGSKGKVYFKNFKFAFSSNSFKKTPPEFLDITVNSLASNLTICVQKDVETFDRTRSCDYSSQTDHLSIENLGRFWTNSTSFVISIQKSVKNDSAFTRFPLEFDLFINVNQDERMYLLYRPGMTFSTELKPASTLKVALDLSSMHNWGMILFDSSDPDFKVDVVAKSGTNERLVANLRSYDFGLYIPDAEEFKSLYCAKTCSLQLSLYTTGPTLSRVSLTYTLDDHPIVLKEGVQLSVPNNMNLYFVYEAESISGA